MNSIRIYTHLGKKEKLLGLELYDLCLLLVVYAGIFIFSMNVFINITVVGLTFLGIKGYKHGKPPRYTESFIRFVSRPGYWTVGREENLKGKKCLLLLL